MIGDSKEPRATGGGFTLIEVIGALLVFSVGVIMLLQITTSLSRQLEYAALNSLITAEGQERLDSMNALAFSFLATGTVQDTMTIRGVQYGRTQTVTPCPCTGGSPSVLTKKVYVSLVPLTGTGPSFTATGYVADLW